MSIFLGKELTIAIDSADIELNLDGPRERLIKRRTEKMRARRLVRTLQGIDEPPLDPRSRVYEVAIFSQLDAHPGVIYSDYKSARLPR